MSDSEQLRQSIIHGLRSRGWGRIEAENEADDRIERGRRKAAAYAPTRDDLNGSDL